MFPKVEFSSFSVKNIFTALCVATLGAGTLQPAMAQCPDFEYNWGLWTWMGGNRDYNRYPVYGTQGVEGPNVKPGGMGATMAWTGTDGLWWMYAGNGLAAGGIGRLSDMWRFNQDTVRWTWMKGNGALNEYGVYGTRGTSAISNRPGSRYHNSTWTANDGTLWMFGGNGAGRSSLGTLNDLWRYNPANNQWTWMKGSDNPLGGAVYGDMGVPALTNTPGSRSQAVAWTGTDGTFWLYGGGSGTNTYSDLWNYNPFNNMWTWVDGSNLPNQAASYGTQGVPSDTNTPGSRTFAATWTDEEGDLWLFGGRPVTHVTVSTNDTWKYDISLGQWIWMHGPNVAGDLGSYGTKTESSPTNLPPARCMPMYWKGRDNCFWICGGSRSTPTSTIYWLNDMWKYDPATNEWTWVSGSDQVNQYAIYGSLGVSHPANNPGGMDYAASGWVDKRGNLWMFGGGGYTDTNWGALSAVWEFDPGVAFSVDEDTPTTVVLSVSDPAGVATVSILEYPADGTLVVSDGTTDTLYYVPPPEWTGVTTGVLSVSDGVCETTAPLQIAVNPINDPPVITHFDYVPKPVCVNREVTFTAVAHDIDGGPLTYLYSYGDGSSGTSNVHSYSTPMVTTATVTVSDGIDSVTSTVQVTVLSVCPELGSGDWEWVNGANQANIPWTPDRPSGRSKSVSWTANDGSLWLFGGEGTGGVTGTDTGRLGDLWRYNVTSGTWTLHGNNTTSSRQLNRPNFYIAKTNNVYGEDVMTSVSPSARTNASSWVDNTGKFWMFGGYGRGAVRTGYLCDLWKFDPATDRWTNRTPDATDNRIVSQDGWPAQIKEEDWPSWRHQGNTWTDSAGNLWLFGGWGWGSYASTQIGYLNDLWKYNVSGGFWQQVYADLNVNVRGVYTGLRPRPGSRYNSVTWADAAGDLWLYGGWGYGSSNAGHLSDLWKYDVSANLWILIHGNGSINQSGAYTGAGQRPGGRQGATGWYGHDGDLWMYGGWGHANNGFGLLNDLWRFDTDSGSWHIMDWNEERAFHVPGDYAGPDARPGGREETVSWVHPDDGRLWLFGGNGLPSNLGIGYLGDLWSHATYYSIIGVPGPIGPVGP